MRSFQKYFFILFIFFSFHVSLVSFATEINETGNAPFGSGYMFSLPTPFFKDIRYFHFLDTTDDASLFRFVSRSHPLNDQSYKPSPLLSISGSHINEAGRRSLLRADARNALWEMAEAFEKNFKEPLMVVSGYRSAEYQQRLWDLGRCTDTLCAPPGQSEHQLGLGIDLFDASTAEQFISNPRYAGYFSWLKENAHLYGWTQSYQNGSDIDEYEVEPWHWRYIGIPVATQLRSLGWSYTEYIRFQEMLKNN